MTEDASRSRSHQSNVGYALAVVLLAVLLPYVGGYVIYRQTRINTDFFPVGDVSSGPLRAFGRRFLGVHDIREQPLSFFFRPAIWADERITGIRLLYERYA